MPTFIDQHRTFQELLRELELVRAHNQAIGTGDSQETLLLFAEAGLVFTTFEHFLRIVLGPDAGDREALYSLLEKAVITKGLVSLPGPDQRVIVKQLSAVRNTILHGNYAQAATQSGCTLEEYFKKQFASELEQVYKVLLHLMAQLNPKTGKPWV